MQPLTKQPYRGTRDFFPKEKRIRDYLFAVMNRTALSFGYESYDGPLLEEVDLYKAKSGEELINEQIYSFTDRGDRFVAIRPEMTPTLARMVANIHRETIKPIRWFSIPNLMRYEKPQRGRVREHWQLNVDIFGAPEFFGELEILKFAVTLFQNFGANHNHFEILLNNRIVVEALFQQVLKTSTELSYKLYKIVDKSKKISTEALQKLLTDAFGIENQTSIKIFQEYLNLKSFDEAFHFLKLYKLDSVSEELQKFVLHLESLQLSQFVKYDPTIVRGLDYYTGVVFEIFDLHPDNRRALAGGGAYANLLQIFQEDPLPGVGLGLGDVTLRDFLESHKLLPNFDIPMNDVLVSFQTPNAATMAMNLGQKLRDQKLNVLCHLQDIKLNKVFSLAEKRGARFLILIGEEELSKNQFQLKNLSTKDQVLFDITQDGIANAVENITHQQKTL